MSGMGGKRTFGYHGFAPVHSRCTQRGGKGKGRSMRHTIVRSAACVLLATVAAVEANAKPQPTVEAPMGSTRRRARRVRAAGIYLAVVARRGFSRDSALRRCCRRRDESDHALRQSPFDVLRRAAALRQQATASASGGRAGRAGEASGQGHRPVARRAVLSPPALRRHSGPRTLLPPDRKAGGLASPTIASTSIRIPAPKPWTG